MQSHTDIAILGAGPAGVAAASALRRLGYEVVLIGTGFGRSLEGLSERALAQLRGSGLKAAAECKSEPGLRTGAWGGAALSGSAEHVVDRAELDRALLRDAVSSRVLMWTARATDYERSGRGWRVRTTQGALDCGVLIDARGRRAQRKRLAAGPALIAVSQRLRVPARGVAYTRIHTLARGWSWLAVSGRGSGCLQVITSPSEPSLREGLETHLRQISADSPEILDELRNARCDGKPIARSATAALAAHASHPGLLAVGDASMAADPLCGHGMYEALRSATVTAAAANSFLSSGDWDPGARFILERAGEIWRHGRETAAFHYGRQAEVTPTPFWLRAAAGYGAGQRSDASGLPSSLRTARQAGIERRPVLNGSRIELRRVVVSPQAPRGVWKIDGVELTTLLEFFRAARTADVVRAARHLSCEPAKVGSESLHGGRLHASQSPV